MRTSPALVAFAAWEYAKDPELGPKLIRGALRRSTPGSCPLTAVGVCGHGARGSAVRAHQEAVRNQQNPTRKNPSEGAHQGDVREHQNRKP